MTRFIAMETRPEKSDAASPLPTAPPGSVRTPLGLDYFASDRAGSEPGQPLDISLGVVIASVFPFACGTINLLVAARSYSPAVTGAHQRGAAIFLSAAVILCTVGLVRLATRRRSNALVFAVAVLVAQLAIAACGGVATVAQR